MSNKTATSAWGFSEALVLLPRTGQEIVREAFDNLTPEQQEKIMHSIGICTDVVNCVEPSPPSAKDKRE